MVENCLRGIDDLYALSRHMAVCQQPRKLCGTQVCYLKELLICPFNPLYLYNHRANFYQNYTFYSIYATPHTKFEETVQLRCNFTLTRKQFICTLKQFTQACIELLVACALLPARNSCKIIR